MAIKPSTRSYVVIGSAAVAFAAVGVAAFYKKPPFARSIMSTNTVLGTSTTSSKNTPSQLSPQEAKNAKIWNRFADGYAKSPIKDEVSYQKKLEITREYLKLDSNVLEFGCGTGGTAILQAPYVQKIRAIDLSSRMIEIAREKAEAAHVENVEFECTGIDSLVANQESYDVILGMSILHLLPNKDEVLSNVYKLVKPGGHFVSSTMCVGDFAKFIGWIAPLGHWLGIIPSINCFTKEELRQSMETAGFTIEREFHPGKDKAVFFVAKKNE